MFKKLIFLILIACSSTLMAQSYYERFQKICEEGHLMDADAFFKEWEKAEPDNPEMYVGLFNHYLAKSNAKLGNPNFLGGYVFASGKDSINIDKMADAMAEKDSLFQIAQNYLNEGISRNIDRLDMYIGRSNSLGEQNVNSEFIQSVKSIVDRNNVNQGQWLWTHNEPAEGIRENFVGLIQNYINLMFNVMEPNIAAVLEISETALVSYPEHYILLSNIGICKAELGLHEESIPFFKRGLLSKPDDSILKLNLADAYVQTNQIAEARKVYEDIITNGEEQFAEFAREVLQELVTD